MDRITQSHQKLLAAFYRANVLMCLAFLLVGVPFIFINKLAVAVILFATLLNTGYCWRLARSGRVQRSLKFFALMVWWVVIPMIYLGQSAAFMGLLLSISVLLAVIVSPRAGVGYGVSYLAASLGYVVLVHFNLQPPSYFIGNPAVQWFTNAIVFWVTLLPIVALIKDLRHSIAEVEKEAGQRSVVEAELRLAVKAAREATVAKSQFLANMSHEIRTPMNAIIGMLKLLQRTELTPQQRDYAVKSDGAAHSLLGLLNDILDFSKVEAGKLALEYVPFRLDQVLRNLSVVLSANVGKKSIEVLFDIGKDIPPVLLGDPMRLQQVLINLGGNAIKFTESGQVVLAIRQLQATSDATSLDFAVRDSGIGIAPENQTQLFSAFSQAESSTTRRFGGTGLGLSICKRLVELMGGSIRLTSAVGAGSTFAFTLNFPVVKDVPEELVTLERGTLPAVRALVVDDNHIAGELLVGMVKSWGGSADLANSGPQALELVEKMRLAGATEFPYPLVYLDWQMQDMDGWETARRLQEMSKGFAGQPPRMIMVTANGHDSLEQRSREEQELLSGFLVKPVTASMLLDATLDAGQGNTGIRQLVKGRSSKRRLNGLRILVVEDNLINQQVAEELLTAEGAIVSMAANGRLGVEAVSSAAPQFDVVLMDIQMPVLDGYGATQLIRDELGLHDLPIVAMTANAMASDRDACLGARMNEHIGKPFDMGQLVALLLRLTGIQVVDAQDSVSPVVNWPEQQKGIAIPGLDVQSALARMSGMRPLYARSARDFLRVLDSAPSDLQALCDGNDHKKCQMFLHTLKGNAGTLGATELQREAARLERMCAESDDLTPLQDAFKSLEDLCQATHKSLNQAIAQLEDAGDVRPEPAAPVSDTLDALRKLELLLRCADLNALQVFAELRGSLQGLPDGVEDALDEALQNLDLDTAHALCADALRTSGGLDIK